MPAPVFPRFLRWAALVALPLILLFAPQMLPGSASCPACHTGHALSPDDPHGFLAQHCHACHLGDPRAAEAEAAHAGMRVTPGQSEDVAHTCGICHAAHTNTVLASLMHSGRGMVNVTRFTFGERPAATGDGNLSDLGHSPADSLLRKLCASCHLGQPLHQIETDQAIGRRGGGCLACHLPQAWSAGHPTLSAKVPETACVGCHSRSGRIALNYAGIAEVDDDALNHSDTSSLGYLEDGRLVERKPSDVHHRAGLSCVDCHTQRDLMGPTGDFERAADAVDIQCVDCHANTRPLLLYRDWPGDLLPLRARIPFPVHERQPFLVTARRGTPLWHVQVTPAGNRLHRKLHGGSVPIPRLSEENHPTEGPHGRLGCNACHSQWAPQCHGCHMRYDRDDEQWDHLERRVTPGAWHEARWGVRNDRPPLGVGPEGTVEPFVPGMIRTAEHPDWDAPRFRRLFAPVAPHTVGRSPDCADCHRSPTALGLGQGRLGRSAEGWRFEAAHPALVDGLPADAFVTLDGRRGDTTRTGARGFLPEELSRILDTDLTHP